MHKRFLVGAAALLVSICVGVTAFHESEANAGAIKVWNNGTDTLTASDLNANFSHIHNLMVGGHGARLVDGDVSASAAISHAKLATPALVAKAWGTLNTICTAGTCAVSDSSKVSTVAFSATGIYNITFVGYAPADGNFGVTVSSSTTAAPVCYVSNRQAAAPQLQVTCTAYAAGGVNAAFTFVVWDT